MSGVLAQDPVIFFGDGGALKSYTSLAAAVAMQSGVPLAVGGMRGCKPVGTRCVAICASRRS